MQPIMHFVGNFGYVAVCIVGAILVMNEKTTFGTIVAFMIYIRLFTNPLSRIAQATTTMQTIAAAASSSGTSTSTCTTGTGTFCRTAVCPKSRNDCISLILQR